MRYRQYLNQSDVSIDPSGETYVMYAMALAHSPRCTTTKARYTALLDHTPAHHTHTPLFVPLTNPLP